MKPLVVKPSFGRSCFLVVGVIGFTLAGIWMVASGGILARIIGVVCILFFGVGGLFLLVRLVRSGATLTVDEGGIRPGNGGFIPWEHVGAIGVTAAGGAKGLGVRVTNIPAYLDSLTPQQRSRALRFAQTTRLAAPEIAEGDTAVTRADLFDHDPSVTAHANAEELDTMAWARTVNGGYDVVFAGVLLNKSADALAAEIGRYRNEAMATSSRGHH